MEAKRWTLGVVLAAAVSLFGLIQADASPFSTYVLTDDLGNQVNGTSPEQSEWETDPGAGTDESGSTDDGSATNGGDNNGHGNNEDGVDSSNPGGGKDNNGHGNNADGVDSSNPGKGKGGPNGAVDESCSGDTCIDDESKGGSKNQNQNQEIGRAHV